MKAGPVTNHERAKMRALREEHLTLDQIAGITGRTPRCVHTHVRDLPFRARPGIKSRTPAENDRLLAALDAGASHEEVGARFGLKPTSVPPIVSRLRKALRATSQIQSIPNSAGA